MIKVEEFKLIFMKCQLEHAVFVLNTKLNVIESISKGNKDAKLDAYQEFAELTKSIVKG